MVEASSEQFNGGTGGDAPTADHTKPPRGKNINVDLSKPITTPGPVGPEFIWERDEKRPMSYTLQFARFFTNLVREPVFWVRKNIVEPNRGEKYYWYHRKFPRALPIDECYIDDEPCMYEANLEYHRTRKVDRATLDILRWRRDHCLYWFLAREGRSTPSEKCQPFEDGYKEAETIYHMKYGDMHHGSGVIHAYNKQKHRMIVERRLAQQAKAEG